MFTLSREMVFVWLSSLITIHTSSFYDEKVVLATFSNSIHSQDMYSDILALLMPTLESHVIENLSI